MITNQNIGAVEKKVERHLQEAKDLARKRDQAYIHGKETVGYEVEIRRQLEQAARVLQEGSKGADAPLYLGGRDSSAHVSILDQ